MRFKVKPDKPEKPAKPEPVWRLGFALLPVKAKAGPDLTVWVWLEFIGVRHEWWAKPDHQYPVKDMYYCTWAYKKTGKR